MSRRPPERHTTFFNITDALAAKGCALCMLAAKAAADNLCATLYENVNDPVTRHALSASLGWCGVHADLARQLQDAFGIAMLYETLCRDVVARIEAGDRPTVTSCPVCKTVREAETRYVGEFCVHIDEPDFRDRFRASDGFCLAHYEQVMRILPDAARSIVQSHEANTFQTLATELSDFIKKHDYQNTAAIGPEADAWQRALDKIAGKDRR
jgi:hypothetical protein